MKKPQQASIPEKKDKNKTILMNGLFKTNFKNHTRERTASKKKPICQQ